MNRFKKITYLKTGSAVQELAYNRITAFALMEKLANYHPLLSGTIPLGISIEGSDLDINCSWNDKNAFIDFASRTFGRQKGFSLSEKIIDGQQTVLVRFFLEPFPVEIFAQKIPSEKQNGYRHLLIEHRLLEEKGEVFKQQLIALKKAGWKTEPAFAKLLNLQGNAYQQLLKLADEEEF